MERHGLSVPAPSAVRSRRVLLPDGTRAASVHVRDGRIERIAEWGDIPPSPEALLDAGDLVVLPGLVDTHVHVNEPGRTDWEGFASATRAAAAGGVTALLDMPLNSIPATTTVDALDRKRAAAHGAITVDVGFIGGVVPGNAAELAPLRAAGVRAFKCFLSPSGVDEFPHVSEDDLREAFPVLASLDAPLMVHAEDPAALHPPAADVSATDYRVYLDSRPVAAECRAIEMLVHLVERCPVAVHVVHVSSAQGVAAIREARRRGLPLTGETCPHYLTFSAEEVPPRATAFKCAPPIRDGSQREALWHALGTGDLELVVSDHSPAPPALKEGDGDFFAAWGGIASLQLGLAVVWSGARARGVPLERVVQWMSTAPARLAGLAPRKGALVPGADADLVVFDPDAEWRVDASRLHHRHPLTPYHGRSVTGVVQSTLVRGRHAYHRGQFAPPAGLLL